MAGQDDPRITSSRDTALTPSTIRRRLEEAKHEDEKACLLLDSKTLPEGDESSECQTDERVRRVSRNFIEGIIDSAVERMEGASS
mmetsp:Transcript_10666/g.40138  ORF Transcript_10666/g.40138 Transcript_10666/m.40138 type:complete len:85 (-) Transcript_10666:203-457(-)